MAGHLARRAAEVGRVLAQLDGLETLLSRLLQKGPAQAALRERQKHRLILCRQSISQAENLSLRAADERRRHQLDNPHVSAPYCVCLSPITHFSQTRSSFSASVSQS
jgi:hypothetical protein